MTSTWVAPGRANLIGEHVDYNDGLVLPFALQFTTTSRVSVRTDDQVAVTSAGTGTAVFASSTTPGEVEGWASYVAGVVWALGRRGHRVPGLDIAISSDVPLGAGLSSSAALTCSVTSAIADELGLALSPNDVAEVSRTSENDYAGAPTGVMDQLASMLGESDKVLLLDCRDLTTRSIGFDLAAAGLALVLVDTQARHALVEGSYGERRHDCELAIEQLPVDSLRDATLAMVATLADEKLRRRAHHVVTEIERVAEVAAVLDAGRPGDIGALLTASHESLRDDYEVSCDELDVTVDAALAAGALGARMVGGGFGGCVLTLCRDTDEDGVLRRVGAAYEAHRWDPPTVYQARPSRGAHRVL